MEYCVYLHEFPNGKKYVGITCQKPERRWRNGMGYASNLRMSNAIKAFGWENIKHSILFNGLTPDEADAKERELIASMDLMNSAKGYNLAPGGDHPEHTEETRRKIGAKSLGRQHSEEFKLWISSKNGGAGNYMYGKHHSEETRQKISKARKGGISPNRGKYGAMNPHAKAVIAIDPASGEVVGRFPSIVDAVKETNGCESRIKSVLKGKGKTSGGYIWEYA